MGAARAHKPGPAVPTGGFMGAARSPDGVRAGAFVDTAPPTVDRPHHVRHVLAPMRVLLVVFAVLTAMAVVALFVLSGQTDQTFAWTIQPPLTAAFLGAGYAAGFVLVVLALRDPVWAHSRVPVLTILAFVALTLVATLLHIDRFHFQPEFAAQPF